MIGPLSSELHPLVAFTPVRRSIGAEVTISEIPWEEQVKGDGTEKVGLFFTAFSVVGDIRCEYGRF